MDLSGNLFYRSARRYIWPMIDGENELKIFQYIVANTKKVENEYWFSGLIEQVADETQTECAVVETAFNKLLKEKLLQKKQNGIYIINPALYVVSEKFEKLK